MGVKTRKEIKVKGSRKLIISLAFIFVIIIIISSTIGVYGNKSMRQIYETIRFGFELVYFITGIFLLIGLYIGYQQLKITVDEYKTRNKRIAIEKSLDFLDMFAKSLLPKINEYRASYNKEERSPEDDYFLKKATKLIDDDFNIDLRLMDPEMGSVIFKLLIEKQNLGLVDIFNEIESLSAIIMHRIADEDVVYRPVSSVFCSFIERELLFLSFQRATGSPYENTTKLYKRWSLKKEKETNALKLLELERMIEVTKQEVAATEDEIDPHRPLGD